MVSICRFSEVDLYVGADPMSGSSDSHPHMTEQDITV